MNSIFWSYPNLAQFTQTFEIGDAGIISGLHSQLIQYKVVPCG